MELTPEEAWEIVCSRDPEWEELDDKIINSAYGILRKESIYRHTASDKYYRFCFNVGVTEDHKVNPFGSDKYVNPTLVVQKQITTMQWMKAT